ncbi:MAG: HNH endonuclease [Chromatiales bacterium]|nr:HNH endonuclease [Chromatiales bacterium]
MRIKRKPKYTEGNAPLNNYTSDNTEIRKRIIKKRGTRCSECKVDMAGKMEGLHMHHINKERPNNREENLQLLCALCHKKIHPAMPVDKDIEGFIHRNRHSG